MRMALAAMALSLIPALPVAAQDTPCRALWSAIQGAAPGLRGGAVSGDISGGGGCLIEDIRIRHGSRSLPDLRLRALRLSGPMLARFAGGQGAATPPAIAAVEPLMIEATDLRKQAAQGMPGSAAGQVATLDLLLVADWLSAERQLRLDRVTIAGAGTNAIELRGRIDNIDLSSLRSAMAAPVTLQLGELDLRMVTDGLFEAWLLPLFLHGAEPSSSADPGSRISRLRADALRDIDDLPVGAFPSPTKQGMRAAVGALPAPRGGLSLVLRAEPGFGPARFALLALTAKARRTRDFAPAFAGARFDIGWGAGATE